MIVLVTTTKVASTPGVTVVDSLGSLATLGNITNVVIHTFRESSVEAVRILSSLPKGMNFVYLRNAQDTDEALRLVVIGLGGKYIDDEYYLQSLESMGTLLTHSTEISNVVAGSSVDVIEKFVNQVDSGNVPSSKYLEVVKNASNALVEEVNRFKYSLDRQAGVAVGLFNEIYENTAESSETVEELKGIVADLQAKISNKRLGGVAYFPQVTYTGNKELILIKSLGSTKFLVSFAMGLNKFMHNVQNKRPKLIVITPVGDVYYKNYKDYPFITQRSSSVKANFYNDVVFVNHPTLSIMKELLDDSDRDTNIVLDLTVTSEKHLVQKAGVPIFYSVDGSGSIKKFGVPPAHCFSSVTNIPNTMGAITALSGYPSEAVEREAIYAQQYQALYRKFLSILRG